MEFKVIALLEKAVYKQFSLITKRCILPTQTCLYHRNWDYEHDDLDEDSFEQRPSRRRNSDFGGGQRDDFGRGQRDDFGGGQRDDFGGGQRDFGPRRENFYGRSRDNYSQNRFSYESRRSSFAGNNLQKPNWNSLSLTQFEKNFYTPSETVQNRSAEEVKEFRNKHSMVLRGDNIPNPIQSFSDYEFPKAVSATLMEKGFEKPTTIQAQGWPAVLSGRDFVGIGQTGSGKTLGYILPALVHASNQPPVNRSEGPIVLVMAPTRELVQQIHQVALEASSVIRFQTACLFGGASKGPQANSLYKGPTLCVATPGRLLDFLEAGVANLRRCTFLVLDEADRMLDMGFEPQIRKIADQIRPDRQTLMWSATWPMEVHELARDFLDDPIQLNVGSVELRANPNITQSIVFCNQFEREDKLIELLKEEMSEPSSKILIFAETKRFVDMIVSNLNRQGIRARGLHGDHSQMSRDRTLDAFRSGRCTALVSTNVASRGLDVDDISLVVNFELPISAEDYVHRIGRTGRADKSGRAISFFLDRDAPIANELIKVLTKANQEIPAQLEQYRFFKKASKRSGFGRRRY